MKLSARSVGGRSSLIRSGVSFARTFVLPRAVMIAILPRLVVDFGLLAPEASGRFVASMVRTSDADRAQGRRRC